MDAYQDREFTNRLRAHLAAHGLDSGGLRPDQLLRLDQFHAGGAEPVRRLIELASVSANSTVIDLGAGLGGPARLVAGLTHARVLWIDRTEAYVRAAAELTARCGLDDRVSFRQGDVRELELPESELRRRLLIHVQMNVADKAALFAGIHRLLRPGGELLLWKICAKDIDALKWPMPWSLDLGDSHLVVSDELRRAIESTGFKIAHWEDRSEWTCAWVRRLREQGPVSGPLLAGVLENGLTRVMHLGQAILAGHVALIEGVATV